MAQRGGSPASGAVVLAALLLFLVAHNIDAATYTVGDAHGWNFNVVNWPTGKSFHAGDQLLFKYSPGEHNVVVVDEQSYKTCTVPAGAKVYESGHDVITLKKGPSFFICGIPGHCDGGMKIAVNAA